MKKKYDIAFIYLTNIVLAIIVPTAMYIVEGEVKIIDLLVSFFIVPIVFGIVLLNDWINHKRYEDNRKWHEKEIFKVTTEDVHEACEELKNTPNT